MNVKYDKIGINYNQTRKADTYLTEQLLNLLNPKPNGQYLDIGCGTGNYTHEFQKRGFQFIGIDPSMEMLKQAKLKNPKVVWHIGTAEQTGLTDNAVDGIIGSLTIHHWDNLTKGFAELARVLKPNGRLVIFTSTPAQMKGYWLNHYFPKMLQASILQMPKLDKVKTAMQAAGFEITQTKKYFIRPDLQDKFLYAGKHQPELYLNPQIQQGISSFSSLANKDEVEKGLMNLSRDIEDDTIKQVIENYENDFGDYLFIVGKNQKIT